MDTKHLLFFVLSLVFGHVVAQNPWEDPFLPHTVLQPIHYDLWMYPDFYYEGTTFQGSITMEINILQDANHLIVHQKMMTISSSEVKDELGQDVTVASAFPYDNNQYWVVETVPMMLAGSKVFLALQFTGDLDNGIVGYYKSTYINSDTGIERYTR